MMEWELSETPFRRMMQFAHVISVSDSTASADITDAFFLSTMWLKKAQKELDCLQKERKNQSKKEYENQKKKLKEICFESHITLESVSFDPTRKGNNLGIVNNLMLVCHIVIVSHNSYVLSQ
jgi:hypothetical protein